MSVHRHQLLQALRALGNVDVFVGAYNSNAVSTAAAAVDPGLNNIGNGTISAITGKARAPTEIITITMLSATTFSVAGSVSGPQTPGAALGAYTSPIINFTITAGATPFVAGDNFTIAVTGGVGNWRSLGAKEGTVTETQSWGVNALTAPEHTGGVIHQATTTLENYGLTIPIIAGEDDLWAVINPTGSKDGVPDTPTEVVTTSMIVVPRDLIPEPGGLSYDGTSWSPAAPDNRFLFIPRVFMTPGDIGRPYENGGKSIVDVTVHPMWHAAGPSGKRLFVRGNPVANGYPDFRM
jgi:hypothetical protein